METVLLALTIVAIVVAGWLLVEVHALNRRASALHQRVDGEPGVALPARSGTVISVEILNPFELATHDSRLARPLIAIAPGVIHRIVYRRTAQIMTAQLAERGVRAEVKIHRSGAVDVE